jgi:glycosyltransferase involved in cell wall biosynthesis
MRIVQVVHSPQRRGAEVFAADLSAELRRQGHPTTTVYLYAHDGPAPIGPEPGDVLLGGDDAHPLERALGFHPRLLARLVAELRHLAPDVVQVNGSRTVKYGALAGMVLRSPWALVYRNIGEPQQWMRGLSRRVLYRHVVMPRLDGFVAVSEATRRRLLSLYRPEVAVARIPRGVDPAALVPARSRAEVRAAASTPQDAPVALFVGSLTPEKRPDRLARVFCRVLTEVPGAHLWVVGDGPERAALEGELAASGALASARLLGAQPGVADHVGAADVLVLTSDTEGIPGVALEAGCLGLPVVATAVGGVPECVVHGTTGLLAEPADEPALAAHLAELLQRPDRRAELGRAARDRVVEHFALPGVAARYVAFYEEVLHARGRAAARQAA